MEKRRSNNYRHGFSRTKLYGVWASMKNRCYNKNSHSYYRYGERGIKVCDEWLNSSSSFCKWALNNGYKEGLEINRVNNDGDYEPSNCEWVTKIMQARNKSYSNNTSGCIGVVFCNSTKKWVAKIQLTLGRFDSKEDAIVARKKAQEIYWKKGVLNE